MQAPVLKKGISARPGEQLSCQGTQSFVDEEERNDRFWHKADILTPALQCPLSGVKRPWPKPRAPHLPEVPGSLRARRRGLLKVQCIDSSRYFIHAHVECSVLPGSHAP